VPQIAAWTATGDERPNDPFVDPETAAPGPADGWSNGGGVLVYPGTPWSEHREHTVGITGVVPSIRLKNWRRGIEDAGYLQLARDRDPARADAIAHWLVPSALGDAQGGRPASWSPRGKAFFQARKALLAVILGRAPVALEPAPATARADLPASSGGSHSASGATGGILLVLVAATALVARGRRRALHA